MQKNVAGQKVIVFAFDATTNLPKTGDAANITAYLSKDFGAVTVLGDTSATEMDATNAKGYYLFDLTQTESNADVLGVTAKSSTANVVVIGAPAVIFTEPPNYTLMSLDSSGRVDAIKLASQTITAAAGITFPSSVASPTNITAGAITTVGSIGVGGIGATAFAAGAIDSAAIAADAIGSSELATTAVNEIRDAIFARAFGAQYGSFTFEQLIGLTVSVLAGILSGAATTTVTIKALDGTTTVVSATVDANGNRSALTVTP